MKKTYWILLEEMFLPDGQNKVAYLKRPGFNSSLKNLPLYWDNMEDALKAFQEYDKSYWENRAAQSALENKPDSVNRTNKPWKNYLAEVRNLPNSKWLNQNFISKHIVTTKEILYEQAPTPLPVLDGYATRDGYEGYDGYQEQGYLY